MKQQLRQDYITAENNTFVCVCVCVLVNQSIRFYLRLLPGGRCMYMYVCVCVASVCAFDDVKLEETLVFACVHSPKGTKGKVRT